MSILSVDTISPIGSGTTITLNAAKIVVGTGITFESNGQATFSGNITGAAGVNLNLDSTLGSSGSTAFAGFDGRLVFDTSYSDTVRGPNKIQLQHDNNWVGGFGISSNALDIYTGGTTRFSRSTNVNTYTTQLTIDSSGNISPSGDVRLTSSAGDNSSTAVTDAAWSRLEFDQDYSDSARGPNKILLTPYSNWKAGFGISSNSFDVYTGGIIHVYGKTNTDDATNKETLAKFITDGAVELYHNNEKKLYTYGEGVFVQDDSSAGAYLVLATNAGTQGSLYGTANTLGFLDGQNHYMLKGVKDGAVELYYDNNKCLETRSNGGIEATDGNFIVGTAGHGIQFDTADSGADQLLDDYEEGVWTPLIRNSSGTGTAGANNYGYYTKIGNVVHVNATVHWTALSGGTTSTFVMIVGLPYQTKNASNYRSLSLLGGQIVGVHNGANDAMNIAAGCDANMTAVYLTGVNGASTAGGNYTHYPVVNSTGTIYGFTLTYLI